MDLLTMRSDTRFLIFGDSTKTQYSNTDIDRNLNLGLQELTVEILPYCGKWQYNGTYFTENLESGVTKYNVLGVEDLRINRVQIKPSATLDDVYECKQIDPRIITGDLDSYAPDSPEYDIRGSKIVIYWSGTIEDVAGGLKVWVQNDITELSGDTDEPNLPKFARRYPTTFAAYTYCVAWEMTNKAERLKRDLLELKEEIKEYYSNRDQTGDTALTPYSLNLY